MADQDVEPVKRIYHDSEITLDWLRLIGFSSDGKLLKIDIGKTGAFLYTSEMNHKKWGIFSRINGVDFNVPLPDMLLKSDLGSAAKTLGVVFKKYKS